MEGVIEGGWPYVWASYIVVWGGMILYAASVFIRRKRAAQDAGPSGPPAQEEKQA